MADQQTSHFPDRLEQEPYEEGYPLPEAPRSESLPPGGGAQILPHFQTFSQIVNYASRVYRYTHDEALRDSWTNALAIRRDPVIMDALRSRQLPTAQLAWHLECEDDKDERQAQAVTDLTDIVNQIPRFQMLKMHALEALWYGRYGVQLSYSWKFRKGKKFLCPRDFKPINGDKLVFRFSGQPGTLVHQQYKGTWEQTDRGRAHFFTPQEREQLIIHRHEPEDADFYEPELGGSVQGVGIRGRIYWLWYLRSQVTAFLMDYLERVGAGGFTIYYYEAGSDASMKEVMTAAQTQWRNNTILFPRYRDQTTGGPGIERVEATMAGAQLLQALITQYFDSVMRRYILGQNLTTEAAATGLGSGMADLHGETFARYVKYDAVNLQDTLTSDLIAVLQKYSPYWDLPPIRFVFDVDKPNATETLGAAKAFFDMGGTVDEDQLRSIIGLEKPQPGHAVLAKMGAMSPAAAGSMPTGMPMLGQPGPDMGGMMGGEAPPPEAGGQPPAGPMMMARRGQPRRFAAPSKKLVAHPRVLQHANSYLEKVGLPLHEPESDYLPVDEERSKRIADLYEQLKHNPDDPKVQAAYRAFQKEILAQYQHLTSLGVQFEPWEHEGQPYKNSQEMAHDARENGHLHFFLGGDFPAGHLMQEASPVKHKGRALSYNDLFRAVHDYYGHALYGNQFGPRGEEHAYRTHARMFSPQARPAMAAETRGQNSWVNYGKHIRDAATPPSVTERPYAEQKNALLPDNELGD